MLERVFSISIDIRPQYRAQNKQIINIGMSRKYKKNRHLPKKNQKNAQGSTLR